MTPPADLSTRPLTGEQRRELRGLVAPSTALFRALLFVLAGLVAAKLFHVAQVLLGGGSEGLWWLLPTAALLAALFVRARRWTGGAELRRRIRRDLAAGVAAVERVTAVAATEIEELEDEGPGFVIETADGRQLLFAGQYLEGPRRRGFPWRDFEILEAPDSKVFLGLRRLGEPLPVAGRRPPLTYEQARELGIFQASYVVLDRRGRSILAGRDAADPGPG